MPGMAGAAGGAGPIGAPSGIMRPQRRENLKGELSMPWNNQVAVAEVAAAAPGGRALQAGRINSLTLRSS
jgi:hypothetical protein